MSTTNNPSNNQIGSASNNTVLDHQRSSSPNAWDTYNDQTDSFSFFSGVGTPETFVTANRGSYYTDTGAAATGIYYKTTNASPNGWILLATGGTGTPDPTFFAYLPTSVVNATGNGAVFDLGTTTALTVLQNGSSMDTGGTFTAPRNGFYQFNISIKALLLTAAANNFIATLEVNGTDTFQLVVTAGGVERNVGNGLQYTGSVTLQLLATDTVVAQIAVGGMPGNTVTIDGQTLGTNSGTFFSGFIIETGAGAGSGKVVQVQEATEATEDTSVAIIPIGSIPQNNEGDSFLTLAFTPLNASNNLRIEVFGWGEAESGTEELRITICETLPIPSDCLVAGVGAGGGSSAHSGSVYLSTTISAGSTATRTYDWRFGGAAGGNVSLQGTSTTSFFGTSGFGTLRITELTP